MAIYLRFLWFGAKFSTHFCTIYMLLGEFSMLKIWPNIENTIWSSGHADWNKVLGKLSLIIWFIEGSVSNSLSLSHVQRYYKNILSEWSQMQGGGEEGWGDQCDRFGEISPLLHNMCKILTVYFAKCWAYFGKFGLIIGLIFIVANGQIL